MAQELLWDPNTLAQRVCNTVRLSGRVVVLRNIKTHTCNINTEQRRKQELWRERKAAVARVLRWLCAGNSAAGPDMWPGSRPIRNQTAGEEKQEKPLVSCLLRVFAQPATLFFPWGSAGSQLSCWILTLYWTRIQAGKEKYLVDNKITNFRFLLSSLLGRPAAWHKYDPIIHNCLSDMFEIPYPLYFNILSAHIPIIWNILLCNTKWCTKTRYHCVY